MSEIRRISTPMRSCRRQSGMPSAQTFRPSSVPVGGTNVCRKGSFFGNVFRPRFRRHAAALGQLQVAFFIGEIKRPAVALEKMFERFVERRRHFFPGHGLGEATDQFVLLETPIDFRHFHRDARS